MKVYKYSNGFIKYGRKTLESLNKLAVEKENLISNLHIIYLTYSNFSSYLLFVYTDKKLLKSTFYKIKKYKLEERLCEPRKFYSIIKEIENKFYSTIKHTNISESFGLESDFFSHTGGLIANAGDIYEELYKIFIIKNKNIGDFEVSLYHILFNHDTFFKLEIKKYILFLSFYYNQWGKGENFLKCFM